MDIKDPEFKKFAKITGFVVIVSVAINIALLIIGRILSAPPETFGPYMYSTVIGLTVLGIIAAAGVYIGIRKLYPDIARANKYFIIISIITLLVSFYPDIMLPYSNEPDDVGWTYGIIANLMLMHIPPAVFVMFFFTRRPQDGEQA